MKNKGFTLAEILITIAIIGVVAALTITSIVTKVSKMEYYSRFISAYSKINTAFNMSVAQNGELQHYVTNAGQTDICREFLSQNLKIARTCNSDNGECFAKSSAYKLLNGNLGTSPGNTLIKNLNGNKHFLLNDGVAISFGVSGVTDNGNNGCGYTMCMIEIDTNGPKGPNQYGRDLFFLNAYPYTNTIQPNPPFITIQNVNGSCKVVPYKTNEYLSCDSSEGAYAGTYCSGRLLREKKMNY